MMSCLMADFKRNRTNLVDVGMVRHMILNSIRANYVKYRPHYPAEIIGYLTETCGLSTDSVVCDIGCGTGISSKLFLENGNQVIGVEPNAAMREAAAEYIADFPTFDLIDGTSTDTSLSNDSIDIVVAAQAFHWRRQAVP